MSATREATNVRPAPQPPLQRLLSEGAPTFASLGPFAREGVSSTATTPAPSVAGIGGVPKCQRTRATRAHGRG
jgi:hypothetical protein